jgi:hypothetical protein
MSDQPCKTCAGKGFFHYDEMHARPCEDCCDHSDGFWQLSKFHHAKYIEDGDNGCCRHCGIMRRDIEQEVTQ